jgi:hypothetical protein
VIFLGGRGWGRSFRRWDSVPASLFLTKTDVASVALNQAVLWVVGVKGKRSTFVGFHLHFYLLSRQPVTSSLVISDFIQNKYISHGLLFVSAGHSQDFISDDYFSHSGTEELNIMSEHSSVFVWSNKIAAIKRVVTKDWNRKY